MTSRLDNGGVGAEVEFGDHVEEVDLLDFTVLSGVAATMQSSSNNRQRYCEHGRTFISTWLTASKTELS